METLSQITATTLVETLQGLTQREREITSDVVRHLLELDSREGYRELGYSSLFSYCTEKLRYSEGAAMRRIKAARALKDSPEIYQKLREGSLTLCSISEVSKVKDAEARIDLLVAAEGQSKRAVEKLVAVLLPPQEPKKETIRVKPVLPPPLPLLAEKQPLVERRYSVSFEADEEFMELLETAKGYSSEFKVSEVLRQALRHFVKSKTPKVTATTTKRVRTATPQKKSRYISKAVRDQVYVRDQQRCTFVAPDGHRCTATTRLELEHCFPHALGGEATEENLRLLCPAHNRLMAERVFGREKVRAFLGK